MIYLFYLNISIVSRYNSTSFLSFQPLTARLVVSVPFSDLELPCFIITYLLGPFSS